MDTSTALQATLTYVVEASDFDPRFAYLADDVVFKMTIPEGTPISGEFRGKQAVIDYFTRIGEIAELRQEQPLEILTAGNRTSSWVMTASRSRRPATSRAASTPSSSTSGTA